MLFFKNDQQPQNRIIFLVEIKKKRNYCHNK
ncbi:unnamed protein product [Spirodela intermedia]|uniref:Uncharacterized protein n=1 Tax=Spirodela intermedia TaxID=51605 RepID=A0ABN7EAM2_SPIIN|nr:unnamed protein product [Spirodela intermedia]